MKLGRSLGPCHFLSTFICVITFWHCFLSLLSHSLSQHLNCFNMSCISCSSFMETFGFCFIYVSFFSKFSFKISICLLLSDPPFRKPISFTQFSHIWTTLGPIFVCHYFLKWRQSVPVVMVTLTLWLSQFFWSCLPTHSTYFTQSCFAHRTFNTWSCFSARRTLNTWLCFNAHRILHVVTFKARLFSKQHLDHFILSLNLWLSYQLAGISVNPVTINRDRDCPPQDCGIENELPLVDLGGQPLGRVPTDISRIPLLTPNLLRFSSANTKSECCF